MIKKISKKHLLNDYKQLKRTLGRQPFCREFARTHHNIDLLCRVLGRPGWRNIVIAAGDKPRRRPDATERMLIQNYRSLKKKLRRRPHLIEYESACFGEWIITRVFGRPGWRRLVEAAGDKLPGTNITRDHLINDFLDLQHSLGRRPKCMEYRRQCHSVNALNRLFGKPGWRGLTQALGNNAMPKGPLTPDHLIQDYLETRAALGCEPSHYKFYHRHRHAIKTIDRVFGKPGWKKLQNAAVRAQREGTTVSAKRIQARKKNRNNG
jgi:hypothetical protein